MASVNGLFSRSAASRDAEVTLAALVGTLREEVAALRAEVATIRAPAALQAPAATALNTVGPIPATPEDATSGRALMRYIAHKLDANEDTVRHSLVNSPVFAPIREDAPTHGCDSITRCLHWLRWLAAPVTGTPELRYSALKSGLTCEEIAELEAQ